MTCCNGFLSALISLTVLATAACATKPEPEPLITCSRDEMIQWGKQNVVAISKGGPIYPPGSEIQQSGVVKVAVDFLSPGTPHRVSLAESSGHPALDEATLNRFRTAELTPPVCSGKSTSVRVIMPMRFDVQ